MGYTSETAPVNCKNDLSSKTGSDTTYLRDEVYYLQNVVFLVEERLFSVPSFSFECGSEDIRTMINSSLGLGGGQGRAIVLDDVRRVDFSCLLRVIYPLEVKPIPMSLVEWTSVLRLSTRWQLAAIRELAIEKMTVMPMDPTTKIVLSQEFSVTQWFKPACEQLVARPAILTMSEAHKIGLEAAVQVFHMRELTRSCSRSAIPSSPNNCEGQLPAMQEESSTVRDAPTESLALASRGGEHAHGKAGEGKISAVAPKKAQGDATQAEYAEGGAIASMEEKLKVAATAKKADEDATAVRKEARVNVVAAKEIDGETTTGAGTGAALEVEEYKATSKKAEEALAIVKETEEAIAIAKKTQEDFTIVKKAQDDAAIATKAYDDTAVAFIKNTSATVTTSATTQEIEDAAAASTAAEGSAASITTKGSPNHKKHIAEKKRKEIANRLAEEEGDRGGKEGSNQLDESHLAQKKFDPAEKNEVGYPLRDITRKSPQKATDVGAEVYDKGPVHFSEDVSASVTARDASVRSSQGGGPPTIIEEQASSNFRANGEATSNPNTTSTQRTDVDHPPARKGEYEAATMVVKLAEGAAELATTRKNASIAALKLADEELSTIAAFIHKAEGVIKQVDAEPNPTKKARLGATRRQAVKDAKDGAQRFQQAKAAQQSAQNNVQALIEQATQAEEARESARENLLSFH